MRPLAAVLLAAMSIGQIDPDSAPFPIDKTKIQGSYIGFIESATRDRTIVEAHTEDPEGQPMTATAVSVPAGMIVRPEANQWLHLEWTPSLAQAGVNYVVVKVTDAAPAAGLDPNSTTVTIAWRVRLRNQAPNVGGCRIIQ